MTSSAHIAADRSETLADEDRVRAPHADGRVLGMLSVAAVASLSAGAVHAAAIGAHAEHPRAMEVFTAVAAFQVAWGALALARRSRVVALIGAIGNALLVAGWVLAKWKGLSFVDGLDEVEPIQFADGLCAALAALSALAAGADLDTVPDIGGPLTQWHIHDNLCFSNDRVAPRVAGLTDANGKCPAPTVKLQPVPMIHVWIIPNPCGPFSALEGVGAGQIKAGETRLCDHVHGKSSGL